MGAPGKKHRGRKARPDSPNPPSTDFEEFDQYLFLVSRNVDEELDEFLCQKGDVQVARWLVEILSNWKHWAAPLSHKDQNTVLWRIGCNPLFLGWNLEPRSKLDYEDQIAIVQAAKEVTLSIPLLFAPDEPMENAYYMWWDLLASDVVDRAIGSAILETLSDLSLHPDVRVQISAIHGLGHLQHPGRPSAVDRYLQFHPELARDTWILQCRSGTVM
ncbi:MAG TPA: hypothetical protein VG944_07250 [Fimbriimonas sp.]|nr:hypothetical protein [Fimbriimonas sp.]